jgi:polyphosphate glucokinase
VAVAVAAGCAPRAVIDQTVPVSNERAEHFFGIDIGGSGVKGAPVDAARGELAQPRRRVPTPKPATPDAVADVVAQVLDDFEWSGPVGTAFPAVVRNGVVCTAANIHQSWIGCDAQSLFSQRCGREFRVVNDADAAGLAELHYGAVREHQPDVAVVVTLGTGIGTALFHRGVLVPNTEFGHIEMDGVDAEQRAAGRLREEGQLSWSRWTKRVDRYLNHLERLLWPDLIVIGGGISKQWDRFGPQLTTRARVVPAALRNSAGIVGAAVAHVVGDQPSLTA